MRRSAPQVNGAAMSDRSGRLASGAWWLLYSGPVGPSGTHAHNAFQLVVHAGPPFVVDVRTGALPGPVVVIDPAVGHAFRGQREHVLVAYIDPDSEVGNRLQRRHAPLSELHGAHPVTGIAGGLRPRTWAQAEDAVRRMLEVVIDGVVETDRGERLRPASVRPNVSGEGSGGGPIRMLARWRQLVDATEHLVSGSSISEAADRGGFVDVTHFVDSLQSMFGLSPSEVIGLGTWLAP